ncbi:MAG: YdeI/OmpD-associated family protein [Myxococcales bacterium]|nr:YdeI/OmpD-associated family protein [Myxococcales bacterium]
MTKKHPDVDAYVKRAKTWRGEIAALRPILRDCGLDEALKWAKPCYTFDGANVAIIQPFKACCALMFFKGSLLKDPEGVLVKQGENSQAAMRMEFTSVAQVDALQATLRSYVAEAVALEKAGAKVDFKDKRELVLCDELVAALGDDPALEAAFEALTPGRQRAYNLHFSGAKRSETRAARVAKCAPQILAGKGLNDR